MKNNFRSLVIIALALGLIATLGLTTASAETPVLHIVSWGETLYSIAAKYGTSVNAVMQANGLSNPNFIYVGQRLSISGGSVPAPIPVPTTYTVVAGDTLFSIANRYGTTVEHLMQLNGLYNYMIYVGQTLRVSGQPSPMPQPQPIPQPVPQPHNLYHIVRPGDYLALIASRYNTSVYAIQIANNLPNPNFIWVGQRLVIPGGQMPLATTTYNPLPPIYQPLPSNPIYVQPVQPVVPQPGVLPPIYVTPNPAPIIVTPVAPVPSGTWQVTLNSQIINSGPCALMVLVDGKANWPVVVATTDGSWISDPKLTGTKPERSPYAVEFAHACTGVWRVIPLGLNIYADVEMKNGRTEIEFRQRP